MKSHIVSASAVALVLLTSTMTSATTLTLLSSREIAGLEREARAGDVGAMERLADVYHFGLTQHRDPRDREFAIYWYQRAVDAGSIDAQFELCNLFDDEHRWEGVGPDDVRADAWCRRAAYAGQVYAQARLARYYENPQHQSYSQAREWTLKSARQGLETSGMRLNLVFHYAGKVAAFDEVWDRLEAEAAAGDSEAQWRLGAMYADDDLGRRDAALARKWLQASADQDNVNGQYYLAAMDLWNDAKDAGPERKLDALTLMRKSADQGNVLARITWANYYEPETAIPDDPVDHLIFDWYLDAAERGYQPAQKYLYESYVFGFNPVPNTDAAEGWKWYLIASRTPAHSDLPNYGAGPPDDIKAEGKRRADAWIAAHPVPDWMLES